MKADASDASRLTARLTAAAHASFALHRTQDFLFNPVVPEEKKKSFIATLSKEAGFQQDTVKFINLLIDVGRLDALQEIVDAFEKEYCKLTDTQVAVRCGYCAPDLRRGNGDAGGSFALLLWTCLSTVCPSNVSKPGAQRMMMVHVCWQIAIAGGPGAWQSVKTPIFCVPHPRSRRCGRR